MQVRAELIVPILLAQDLWGLLIAQQCHQPRQWQQTEIDLLQQLADQLGIAIQQAELHKQIECLKVQQQLQLQKQTSELQYFLKFEPVVRRITQQICDNLDEIPVLQAAMQELAQLLQADCCQIEVYSNDQTIATVAYEYTTTLSECQGLTRVVADFSEIYQLLLQKQPTQSMEIVPGWNPKLSVVAQMACPIFDAQGILGNIWVKKQTLVVFNEFQVKLVQLVANQCAIALRRAKLCQVIQTQAIELEKVEHLKHEFLRTPTMHTRE